MTAITSAGLGSGLDVNSIVTQLVAAERAAPDQRLSSAQSKAQTKISALGNLKSLFANLQTVADGLKSGSNTGLGKLTAASANTDFFTATATTKAVPGNYGIEVDAIAVANKRASNVFASSSAVVGNGDVTIGVGSASFTVTLADGANTLADLRDKINSATDNTGVGAAIVNDSSGARLLLTSRATGTANALTVTSSLLTTNETQPAADAVIKVDGFSYTSSSNQVSGAIDGLTINVAKAEVGTTTQLNVTLDQSAASTAIQGFVTAYNASIRYIAAQTAYNPTSRSAGTLLGDATTLSASQQLRNIVGGTIDGSGTYSSLAQIGITTATDGTLTLDTAKLTTALSTDYTSVQKLFGGDSGVGTRLSTLTKGLLDDSGQIKAQTDGLNATLKDISKQQDALDTRIKAFETRTRAQFTALDTLLSNLKSTGDYLTQQLAKL